MATVPFLLISGETSYWLIGAAMVFRGFGIGMSIMPAMTAAYTVLRPDQVNDATPQLTTLMRVGGSIGTAILTVILQSQLTAAGPGASADAMADGFSTAFGWVMGITVVALLPTILLMAAERRARLAEARPAAHRRRRRDDDGGRVSAAAVPARTEALDAVQQGAAPGAERRAPPARARPAPSTPATCRRSTCARCSPSAHDETTAGEIARAAQISPAAVTGMLDDLEAAGIVARHRSETDRRCVLVTLTDHGREVLDDARRRWRARWDEALRDVPDADLQAAARVMHAIGDLLDEL